MKTSPRTSTVAGSRSRAGQTDGPQVGGDVLAGRAVAAGRALDEAAALVAQRDGQAVDLELGDVAQLRGRLRGGRQAQALADALVEGAQLVLVEDVAEREHRPPWTTSPKVPVGRRPTRWVGESAVTRAGKAVSMATSSRIKRSYSASLSSGASAT
jgi:hypothetical protein